MPDVLVKGSGVAACCCAALLERAGFRIFLDSPSRGGSPVLMLSAQTQRLLIDVFGRDALPQEAVAIHRRVVAWGPSAEPVEVPHSGIVVSEAALLDCLWSSLSVCKIGVPEDDCWSVISSKSALPSVSQHDYGSRTAFTYRVKLKSASAGECWVESVDQGWLFLVPTSEGHGSLISVGEPADVLLTQSRLVADQCEDVESASGAFPAYPRIITPLGGPHWLACGTAAIAFDPIAGEGAGHAIREGILASAVIRAAHAEDSTALLNHYSGRLVRGFSRHIQQCCRYYQAGGAGSWWKREYESLLTGLSWAGEALASIPDSGLRLVGFELTRAANL